MADIYDWSTTADDNATADSDINWSEGQPPSTVNGSARKVMARLAEFRKDIAPTRSSAGSGNAYTVTSNAVASGAYNDGEIICFIADRVNTSSCTLNINGRGAVAFRSEVGREFASGEIRANQPIIAFYTSDSNEFLAVGSGYHVNAMTSGLLTQSVVGRLIQIGTPVLSIAPTPATGYIRLTEATQTLNKASWPELSSWLSGLSYPWGSASTTFNLPPAAGYVLRFASTTASIDTSGARLAGSVQADQNKAHTHSVTGTTSTDGAHTHTDNTVTFASGTNPGGGASVVTGTSTGTTGSSGSHSHTVTGTAATDGGAEVRVKNVAMHVDIFASSALATGTMGQFGFAYQWDSGIASADPGNGRVRGNNATLASITALYISETDGWGVNVSALLGTITAGQKLKISRVGSQNNVMVFSVTGTVTDNGTHRTIPVTALVASGSFSNNDQAAFEILSGADGADGAAGTTVPDISGLTEDTTPDRAADYMITYDTSASTHKKVRLSNFQPREVITSDRTYYVRSDGNDSNTGLADTAGAAFLTWQAAVNAVTILDFNNKTVTIQAGSESGVKTFSFTGPIIIGGIVGGGVLLLRGTGGSGGTSTVLSSTGDTVWVQSGGSTIVKLAAMKVTSSGGNTLKINYGSLAGVEDGFNFGSAAGFHVWIHDNQACFQILTTTYTISGGAQAHLFIQNGAHVFIEAVTLTLTGTPSFSLAFAYGYVKGSLQWVGNTVVGSATGRRWIEYRASTINVNGLGENVLPGSVHGLTDYREMLTTDRTYYVRSDGSDTNSGTIDTAGGAFLTWQRAITVIAQTIDINGKTVTIQHGSQAGTTTFTDGAVINGPATTGTVILRGNGDTTVVATSGLTWNVVQTCGVGIQFANMKCSSSANSIIKVDYQSLVSIGADFNFGTAASYHLHIHDQQAMCQILAVSYKISGGAAAHVFCQNGGLVYIEGCTLNLSGTPAFSSGFFLSYPRGHLQYIGNTVSGTATGKRYDAYYHSIVNLNGSAETVLPGGTAGSVDATSTKI